MAFRSTSIAGGVRTWQIDGDLTIGDITQPVSLAVEFGGVEPFMDGRRHAGFEAKTEIRRKAFGIDFKLPPGMSENVLSDVVKIEIDLELLAP
jgi:polyisoprenoid-binding protein YceI